MIGVANVFELGTLLKSTKKSAGLYNQMLKIN